jgi:alpha-L-glutamate ligase-like protein/uncharacterized protein (TIGR02421 family)
MALNFFKSGILGINGRNLLYIKPLNNQDAIRFADDKLKTKNFLAARDIPVPRLIAKITKYKELQSFQWKNLPETFVVKPNAGFGGEGIVVIESKEDDTWLDKSGKKYTESDLREHVEFILRGEYAINNLPDSAIIEQKIISHPDLALFSKYGLPDVRVIVYNLVPVMAMLRVPTKESQGKANLHGGAVGIGIDLAKGETTHGIHRKKIINVLPKTDTPFKGIKLPFWNQILLSASKIQTISTLGYLAVDVAIDEDGPMILEINARAGLSVQSANREGLRQRLEKIKNIKVITPEKGVRLAQDLFGNKVEKEIEEHLGKHIIGLETEIELNLKHGTKKILAQIDTGSEKNYLEKSIFNNIESKEISAIIDFTIKGTRSRGVFSAHEMKDKKHQAIIGGKTLGNFLIDPTLKIETKKTPTNNSQAQLKKGDQIICSIDQKLSLLTCLKPTNIQEEKIKCMTDSGYSPQFLYKSNPYKTAEIRKELKAIKLDDSPLGTLLAHKRNELLVKIDILENIGNDELFKKHSVKLFGKPSKKIVEEAETLLKNYKKFAPKGDLFDAVELKKRFQSLLAEYGLKSWRVILKENMASRCTIGKNNSILIKKDIVVSEAEIEKLLIHELETHVLTAVNGQNQPYLILNRGLAGYLETQEGLAIYNQERAFPIKSNLNLMLGTILADMTLKASFRELYNFVLKHTDSHEAAWNMAYKAKRGMRDTEKPGGFTKNHLYLQGYHKVKTFLEKTNNMHDLYMGKINLDQLSILKKIPDLKPPKLLPKFNER